MRDSYTNSSKTKQIESSNLEFFILQNESMKRIFGKQAYEMNPQYKSFEIKLYKLNPQYESLRFGFASPLAWICKDSFCAIVLRIREESLDS
jgi:hypothetical protein